MAHTITRGLLTTAAVLGLLDSSCTAQQTATTTESAAASVYDTFVFSLDLLEGATGYFKVEGFDGVQPALTMVRGETYEFDQTDSSNWYHPLGFAYFPDGAHKGVDELEAGIGSGDEPIYIINGEISDLDTYEPQFFFPEETWLETNYTVQLTVTDPDVTEIFYFCHIHDDMSGRIHIVDAEGDEPAATEIDLYDPMERSDFDVECGTFLSDVYAPEDGTFDSELCPDQHFVCGDPDDSFDRCMHAIDCKMNVEMRIERDSTASNTVVFMQQMIPHHENAVNMARILLKNPGEDGEDEEVTAMLREIVNTQNAQITFMQGWLEEAGASVIGDTCENDVVSTEKDVSGWAIGIMAALGVVCLVLCGTLIGKSVRGGSSVSGGTK